MPVPAAISSIASPRREKLVLSTSVTPQSTLVPQPKRASIFKAGDNFSSIYCFNQAVDRLWKLGIVCGSAFSIQLLGDRLYIVTTDGSLACIDASQTAINAAQAGIVPQAINIKAPTAVAAVPSNTLETTSNTSQGVIVECFKAGSQLRIRVVSPGYNSSWKVQFPKDIRQEGARYLVEEARLASRDGFYRAYSDIKILL